MPVRATLSDGTPDAYWDMFDSEAYRAHVNMALDWAWAKGAKDDWEVEEAKLLLAFFTEKGPNATYGSAYSLDGTQVLDSLRDFALIAVNGTTAMVAGTAGRRRLPERGLGHVHTDRPRALLLRHPRPDGAADPERAIHRLVAAESERVGARAVVRRGKTARMGTGSHFL